MSSIRVPAREDVSPSNQANFDKIQKSFGMVPNLYATFAHSENALSNILALQNSKSSITGKAREIVNLVVSQVNQCRYCLAAHTMLGKQYGFSDEQIIEIRVGQVSFDAKLDVLARLTRNIVENRGHADLSLLNSFTMAGWTTENLVDLIVAIGEKVIANYMHSMTRVPVDFPAAPEIG